MGRPVRRPVKKNGLPPYVSQHFDRHGRLRTRFRKTGLPSLYAKSVFPSRDFWVEYDAWLNSEPAPAGIERSPPGTVADLVSRFFANPSRLGPSPETQKRNRAILDSFRAEHGHRMVADVRFDALDGIIARKAETAPWQAKKLRRLLGKLFGYAVKLKLIDTNPVPDTEAVRPKAGSWHTWTEAEIEQFIARHPVGTKPYLAMMLMLWTGQRRSDAVRMKYSDIANGWLPVKQKKTDVRLSLPIAGPLIEAIESIEMPGDGDDTFLRNGYGRPFTPDGFGNWFRARCDEAGLPQCSAHGLRKAISRRMAEIDLSNQSIKSVTGHKTDSEVSRYTRDAEQVKMAREAMARLAAWHLANQAKRLDK